MNVVTDSEFADHMMRLATSCGRFEPTAIYDPDGDCIEFLAKPHPFYARRIDDLVTVYHSQETDEIVGSLIKGVTGFRTKILEKMPGFAIEIQDGRVRLVHIFLAQLWASNVQPLEIVVRTYKKLIEVAEEADLEADMCLSG
jgi:hypothetical protein